MSRKHYYSSVQNFFEELVVGPIGVSGYMNRIVPEDKISPAINAALADNKPDSLRVGLAISDKHDLERYFNRPVYVSGHVRRVDERDECLDYNMYIDVIDIRTRSTLMKSKR